jgi:hypothetical protein
MAIVVSLLSALVLGFGDPTTDSRRRLGGVWGNDDDAPRRRQTMMEYI